MISLKVVSTLFNNIVFTARTTDTFQQPELFEFDHVHPDSSIGSPIAILYGALGTDCFKEFHNVLVGTARQEGLK